MHPLIAVAILGSWLTSTRSRRLLICFQAAVTQSRYLHTSEYSFADPRLISFRTLLFYVVFRSSYLTLPHFQRGSCHAESAWFVPSCNSTESSLHGIALSAWVSAYLSAFSIMVVQSARIAIVCEEFNTISFFRRFSKQNPNLTKSPIIIAAHNFSSISKCERTAQ